MMAGIRFFLAGGATGLDLDTLHKIRAAADDECVRRADVEYERRVKQALGEELAEVWLSRGRLKQGRYLTFKSGPRFKRHIACGVEVEDERADRITVAAICRASQSGPAAKVKEWLHANICDRYPASYDDICWNCMR